MGWYSWVPFMECYHGLVSLDHEINGFLEYNGKKIDFSGGRGYTEKDWGKSFPEAWVWMQSNHFGSVGTSLTASVAIIPWVRKPFLGFITGLWHNNKLYRFTTYLGSKIVKFDISDSNVDWVFRNKSFELEISATRSEGALLHAPTLKGMTKRIEESIGSVINIKLSGESTKAGKVLFLKITGRKCRIGNRWRSNPFHRNVQKTFSLVPEHLKCLPQ